MQLFAIHFVITQERGSFWLYLLLSNTICLFLKNIRLTPQRFQTKYRILEHFDQTLYLTGRIIRVLGPPRVLGLRKVLSPAKVLGPPRVLAPPRVVGPPNIRILIGILGPLSVLDAVLRYAYESLHKYFFDPHKY